MVKQTREVTEKYLPAGGRAKIWNKLVTHPMQSWEWGEFRKKTGVKIARLGVFANGKLVNAFQLTIHKIPYTLWSIGYLPKGPLPTKEMLDELVKIGHENNCIFIQLEPNVEVTQNQILKLKANSYKLLPSGRPLFTKYNFVIDLTKDKEELLAAMHPKTRYNIRVAERHNVQVEERQDERAFKIYLKLFFATTKRQHYFGHTPEYHGLMWKTLRPDNRASGQALTARLLIAYYRKIPLVAWMILHFDDTIYYPYGGSSDKYKNVMASNLLMWKAIRIGKRLGAKRFDLWGALGPNPNPNDPWYGFHRFKQGYGGKLVEYLGSYDLVLNPLLYWIFHLIDKLRWLFLRLK